MFTGIIETLGVIVDLRKEKNNLHFQIESSISSELKIDQSVSHDGVCLTVINIKDNRHTVTAIEETLKRSSLRSKKSGDSLNLERSLLMNGRLDGHIVQGHVDEIATVKKIEEQKGSWLFTFKLPARRDYLVVDKGSVCVNGVSLTITAVKKKSFSVAIIPFTFEHTNFNSLKINDEVNIEYDIIGKYVKKMIGREKFS